MSEQHDFPLEIVTPSGVIFTGRVHHVMVPGADGYFGVLANHAPLTAVLQTGKLTVDTAAGEKVFAISGGFIEVTPERVALLSETAEPENSIDIPRAEEALKRAQERLAAGEADLDVDRSRLALARALNRMRIASHE
ncbi:MAG: F0F1 ATP synthase subunit epsilon [Candidatus Delongbacteria bacterium]|nr:F0F1 ATP synthase subunit epsilon [bacterium]MBL7033977.1 F0F1 ATP synthase subunit epsilon [Candidatus Delongbacteria bacterium]